MSKELVVAKLTEKINAAERNGKFNKKEFEANTKILMEKYGVKKGLAMATTIVMNDYIFEQPPVVDLASMMFAPAQVQGSTMVIKTGYKTGSAIVHAIGTPAPTQMTYSNEIRKSMERISWMTSFDVSELSNEFLQTILNNGADINEKMALARLKVCIELIKASITNDGECIYGKSASLQAATLKSLIRQLFDKSDANQPKAIVGRYSLVSQICDFTGFGPATQENIDNNGFLGRFHGAAVIAVNDSNEVFVDSLGHKIETPVIADNGIYLVGGKCGYEGKTAVQTLNDYDVRIPAEIHHTYQDYAAAIIDKRRIGYYEIG